MTITPSTVPLSPVLASLSEVETIHQLAKILSRDRPTAKLVAENGEAIPIPESLHQLICQIVGLMAMDKAVAIAHFNHELFPHEAA